MECPIDCLEGRGKVADSLYTLDVGSNANCRVKINVRGLFPVREIETGVRNISIFVQCAYEVYCADAWSHLERRNRDLSSIHCCLAGDSALGQTLHTRCAGSFPECL